MSIVAKKIIMGSGAVALPSDDEFNRVSFLSHFDGANNGVNNVFDDASASNHTITASGNVTQGSFSPFARPDGEWGVSLDGNDYLTVAASNDFDVSDGDITIEGFFNFTSTAVASALWTLSIDNNDANGIRFQRQTTGFLRFDVRSGNSYVVNVTDDTISLPLNTWHHVAVTRTSGGAWKVYVNGVIAISATESASSPDTSGIPLSIGANYRGTNTFMNGHISNFRVVKGTIVYTSNNFTPPTSKLTAITNTKLLTCQSNRFVDNSASGHAITPAGNAEVTAFGPFLTSEIYSAATNGASAYFDGSGDYLSTPSISIGTGTFSFECWVYPIGITDGNNDNIIRFAEGNNSTGVQIYITNNSSLRVYRNAGTVYTITNVFLPNQWYKLLFIRESNTLTIYVNGVSRGTTSVVDNLDGVVRLGANGSGEFLTGYMSGARLSDNARQSGNYTVETAPFTTDSNTDFLINMADGQAIDSAAQNNLTLYGTAKTSTAQKKFGTASLLLDGNSDYAIFPNGATGGAGDWTIEMFIFSSNVSSGEFGTILDNRPDSTNGLYQTLVLAAATLKFATAGAYKITSGDSLSANTWYHVALCKSSSSTKMFIDGTQTGSTYTDNNTYINTSRTQLGAEVSFGSGVAEFFNGYIDEIRLSSFARYTSNFTAPAEPFADKGK